MNTPERVVITKDEDSGELIIPDGSVYVGRGIFKKDAPPILSRHPLSNPHGGLHPCRMKECKKAVHGPEGSSVAYRRHLAARMHLVQMAVSLADQGLDFACRCPLHVPCHIDVLLDAVAIHRWMHRDGRQPSKTSVLRAIDPELYDENVKFKRAKRKKAEMRLQEASR